MARGIGVIMKKNVIAIARITLIANALLGLAACGDGSTPTYSVGGKVAGLAGSGLELSDSGGDHLQVSANGFFTIATAVAPGAGYSVSVTTQPQNPLQTCLVQNGSGIMGSAPITNVSVTCTTNTYTVGGVVSGPVGTGLVLGITFVMGNGHGGVNYVTDSVPVPTPGGPFTFTPAVLPGTEYMLSVSSQPTNPSETCAFSNVPDGPVSDSNISVTVSCTDNLNAGVLNGTYTVVGYEGSGKIDDLWTLTFDGTGDVSGSEVQNDAGIVSTHSVSGTYVLPVTSTVIASLSTLTAVANSGLTLTLAGTPALSGYVSFDGNTMVLTPLTSGQDPGIMVGIKQGQTSFTNQNLSGTFELASYGSSATVGSVATLSFDGAGNLSGSAVVNDAGAISDSAVSGTYALAADGTLTLTSAGAAPLSGGVSADGNTLVLVQTTAGQPPAITLGIKQGQTTFVNGDMNAVYAMASYDGSGSHGILTTLTFDGAGNANGPVVQNNAGVISSGNSFLGTYAVAATGALTLDQTGGASFTGGVSSADGIAFLSGEMTAGQSAGIQFAVAATTLASLSLRSTIVECDPATNSEHECVWPEPLATLTNKGTVPLYIFGIAIIPAPDFRSLLTPTSDCPASLAPGQACTIQLENFYRIPEGSGETGYLAMQINSAPIAQTAISLRTPLFRATVE
jgi:hypothetical protein